MSTTSKQSIKSKLALIFAGTIFAVSATVPARANTKNSVWDCSLNSNKQYAGRVVIWWGHRPQDAAWACNNWKSECGNQGGCQARLVNPNDIGY